MQIRWNDVHRADQPGVYALADGRPVQVSAVDIARWLEHPGGAFDTYWHPGTPQRCALLTLTDFHEEPDLADAGEHYRA
jgi:hypothetical protein